MAINESYGEDSLSSDQLQSSISSLSTIKSARHTSSETSRTYRRASELFVTQQVDDALLTLIPLLSCASSSHSQLHVEQLPEVAPVATASKSSRIKIWSLYLAIIDAVIQKGEVEGKALLGRDRYRDLIAKAEDGKIWDEIVLVGYPGTERRIDIEVVISLTTFTIAHAQNQKTNQRRVEGYLKGYSQPDLDVSNYITSASNTSPQRLPRQNHLSRDGTSTPRDLASRIKLLELYVLHVLPANGEWEYAQNFVRLSEVLDDERREAFTAALQSLHDEQNASRREQEETSVRQSSRDPDSRVENTTKEADDAKETLSQSSTAQRPSRGHQRDSSEIDYGIESHTGETTASMSKSDTAKAKNSTFKQREGTRLVSGSIPGRSSRNHGLPAPSRAPSSFAITYLQHLLTSMAHSFRSNPLVLLRMLLLLVGLVMALGRRDIRDRARHVAARSWYQVKQTVGMGVKVSYI